MSIFRAPKAIEIQDFSFLPIECADAISWAFDFDESIIKLTKEYGNEGCFEKLSVLAKCGVLIYNILSANLSSRRYHGDYTNILSEIVTDGDIKEINDLFPLIYEVCKLNIGVTLAPSFITNGNIENCVTCRIRTMKLENQPLVPDESDIEYIKDSLENRKVFIYSIDSTLRIYSPDELTPMQGFLMRCKFITKKINE